MRSRFLCDSVFYPASVAVIVMALPLGVGFCMEKESAASKSKAGDNRVLAQINQREITLQEFSNQIASVGINLQPFIKAQKGRYLQGLVEEELLFQEGQKRKMSDASDIQKQLDQVRRRLVVQKLIKDEIKNKVTVSESEIAEYYKNNAGLYQLKERSRISQIIVKDKKTAEDIFARLKKGEDFAGLASKLSVDSSKAKGGSLGFMERGRMGDDFDKVAFALKPGEVSAIAETPAGFRILKMVDYQPAKTRPLAEVKENIRKHLLSEKEKKAMRDYVGQLKQRSKVVVYDDLLKEIK